MAVRNGGDNNSDWPGWSDDDARAYIVGLFQPVQQASMLNRVDDYETGSARIDLAMIQRSHLHLHETVSGRSLAGDPIQWPWPKNVKFVKTQVEDVGRAAHLGGLVTQEWTGTFEIGEVQAALAFDFDIAESISADFAMPVGAVRADFEHWLGMRGADMVADLVEEWLADLAGRSG